MHDDPQPPRRGLTPEERQHLKTALRMAAVLLSVVIITAIIMAFITSQPGAT